MPVYEYRCSKGHEYEMTQSFSASSTQKCITCGAKAQRQISRPAVIFKGSGFYSTDNRGSSGGRRGDSDSSDSKSDSKSDSAPKVDATSSGDNGHGHSHGPGGHSHGSSDTKSEAASVD